MTIITDAVEKLRTLLEGSGCEDGIVTLKRNPDAPRCQYERGVTLEAHFGGGHGQVVTDFPVQATTRISSMYGSSLASPQERSAALAIINTAAGFLCLARKLRPCSVECFEPCLTSMKTTLTGKRIGFIGTSRVLDREFAPQLVKNPEQADVLLIVSDGAIDEQTLRQVEAYYLQKQIIFIGPSFAGISALLPMEQWCPYGR